MFLQFPKVNNNNNSTNNNNNNNNKYFSQLCYFNNSKVLSGV